jgi:hypothetical protein
VTYDPQYAYRDWAAVRPALWSGWRSLRLAAFGVHFIAVTDNEMSAASAPVHKLLSAARLLELAIAWRTPPRVRPQPLDTAQGSARKLVSHRRPPCRPLRWAACQMGAQEKTMIRRLNYGMLMLAFSTVPAFAEGGGAQDGVGTLIVQLVHRIVQSLF